MPFSLVTATANTSTGLQTITGDLGGVNPKAAIIRMVGDTGGGGTTTHSAICQGMTDGSNAYCIGRRTVHASNPKSPLTYNNFGGVTSYPVLAIPTAAGSPGSFDGFAKFDSWTTDGIVIDWTVAPSAGYKIEVLLFGGSDVSVDLQNKQVASTASGAVTVTTGFATTLVFAASTLHDNLFGINAGAYYWTGIGTPAGDVAMGHTELGFLGSAWDYDLRALTSSNRLIYGTRQQTSDVLEVNTENYTATGYDLRNTQKFSSVDSTIGLLSIKIDGYTAGPFSDSTPVAIGNKSVTGIGGQPDLVTGFAGQNNSVNNFSISWSYGTFSFDGTTEGGLAVQQSHSNPANASSEFKAKAYLAIDISAFDLEVADYVSMDPDGFTIDFTSVEVLAKRFVGVGLYSIAISTTGTAAGSATTTGIGALIQKIVGTASGSATTTGIRGGVPAAADSYTAAAYDADTTDVILVLLTISHSDLSSPIRVVNNTENITSRGNEFIGYPFDVILPDNRDDAPPRAQLTIDNVSREIAQAIRTISSRATIEIEVIRASDPDTVEHDFPNFQLDNVTWNALTVSGELVLENLTQEPFPARNFTPADFPGVFKL